MQRKSLLLQGFDLAITRVQEMHKEKTGKSSGGRSWLAKKLGVTRQSVDNWGKRGGFPPKHVAKVAKFTGLDPTMVRPPTTIVEMPTALYDVLCKEFPQLHIESVTPSHQRKL